MRLSKELRKRIEITIENSIKYKLNSYKPETINMPFHYRLLGKDRISFIR